MPGPRAILSDFLFILLSINVFASFTIKYSRFPPPIVPKIVSLDINIISSIHIEDSIPKYGVTYHSTSRLPSAYSRAWRSIRENQEYKKVGISLVKEVTSEGNAKVWQIMK